MTMHKALHPRYYVDRQYVSRRERGRGLTKIEGSVDASIHRLEDCIEKRRGRLITATRNKTKRYEDQQNDNKQETKVGRKNPMGVLSDKQAIFHEEKESLTEKYESP